MALELKLTRRMQMALLAGILGGGALLAVINLVALPKLAARKADLKELAELQLKLEEQRRIIKGGTEVQRQLEEVQAAARTRAAHIPLPVLGNYLLGMEGQLRAGIQGLEIEFNQVVNQDQALLPNSDFRVHRVRVNAQAGYDALVDLFRNLQATNAMLAITGLTILPQDDQPERHQVIFTAGWLIWNDPARRPEFLAAPPAATAAGTGSPGGS